MKYLIVCTLSLLTYSLKAQSKLYKDSLSELLEGRSYLLNDYNKQPFQKFNKNTFQPKTFQLNTTPKINDVGIVKLPAPKLTYVNNINYSNVYQATPDKMYVIKPDSTLKLNMPVADIN